MAGAIGHPDDQGTRGLLSHFYRTSGRPVARGMRGGGVRPTRRPVMNSIIYLVGLVVVVVAVLSFLGLA
ncbi:hypothetical protein [Mangrovibrevibacter kandeliae]|uniref:hypothetical protein n=1 Tax=Mangrovibrevibacter kandeliae TaxID=2968473 RepID=UPI002118CAF4|nr:hypothetical protein [Aurantimonas sp. CSK15Z-1]MCQ8782242.1 hypothetical protein [Aurantimonas sp. CSK15Z-1]